MDLLTASRAALARRLVACSAALSLIAPVPAVAQTPATAAAAAPVPSVSQAAPARPAEPPRPAPLVRLKAGNERFVKGASSPVPLGASTREALAKAQNPFAMVLSCADSRVPPEYLFNVGLGDLFVVRAAGEVVDRSVMASLEYGAEHLKVPLLVVMGHESCGAVKAAVDATPLEGPNLQYLVRAIRAGTDRTPSERRELRDAILANVEQVINDALAGSAILRRGVAAGTLQVVGAYYELASGRVMFSEPVSVPPSSSEHRE